MVVQFHEYTKNHWNVHVKWVNFMVCEIYLKLLNKCSHKKKQGTGGREGEKNACIVGIISMALLQLLDNPGGGFINQECLKAQIFYQNVNLYSLKQLRIRKSALCGIHLVIPCHKNKFWDIVGIHKTACLSIHQPNSPENFILSTHPSSSVWLLVELLNSHKTLTRVSGYGVGTFCWDHTSFPKILKSGI